MLLNVGKEQLNHMKKKVLLTALCLAFITAACNNGSTSDDVLFATPSDSEIESIDNELGLTIDGIYYSIPCEMSAFFNDGWNISSKIPYFDPIASDDYYEMKSTLSLTENGESIIAGGDIIKLIEKEGSVLEVRIANLDDNENEPKRIEDCTVIAISAIYGDTDKSIQFNGIELSDWTSDDLLSTFLGDEGWEHIPTNFMNYPEFGVSKEYDLMRYNDRYTQEVTIYFNLEDTAFVITVMNKKVKDL